MGVLKDLIPVLSALIGAAAIVVGQWWAERRQAAERRKERWRLFQHETLLDLQDSLTKSYQLKMQSLLTTQDEGARYASLISRQAYGVQAMRAASRIDDLQLFSRCLRVLAQFEDAKQVEDASAGYIDLVTDLGHAVRHNHHRP